MMKQARDSALARRKRIVRLLILVSLMVVSFLCGALVQANATEQESLPAAGQVYFEQTVYIVKQGDTLWDIAKTRAIPGEDIRKVVHEIRQANGLKSAMLMEGQELVLPVRY